MRFGVSFVLGALLWGPAAAEDGDARFVNQVQSASLEFKASTARAACKTSSLRGELGKIRERLDPTCFAYPRTPAELERERRRLAGALQEVEQGPAGRRALDDIRRLGVPDVDFYHGSHVVVKDGGRLYDSWKALGASPRISSHYRGVDTQQYELRLEAGVILFGKTAGEDSWFQMEAHGASPQEALLHVGDYLKHKLEGGQNVGPMGMSPCTEGNPIVIADSLKGCQS